VPDIDLQLIAHDFVDWANDLNPNVDGPRDGPDTLERVIAQWLYDVLDVNPDEYQGVTQDNVDEVAEEAARLVDIRQAEFSLSKPWPQ
jgi:hypothetical protein